MHIDDIYVTTFLVIHYDKSTSFCFSSKYIKMQINNIWKAEGNIKLAKVIAFMIVWMLKYFYDANDLTIFIF